MWCVEWDVEPTHSLTHNRYGSVTVKFCVNLKLFEFINIAAAYM